MKRLFTVALLTLLVLTMMGCDKDNTAGNAEVTPIVFAMQASGGVGFYYTRQSITGGWAENTNDYAVVIHHIRNGTHYERTVSVDVLGPGEQMKLGYVDRYHGFYVLPEGTMLGWVAIENFN